MKCRHCYYNLDLPFIDLGSAPPSNAFLAPEALRKPEKWYPLQVLVCTNCWLVQTVDFIQADEIFSRDYAYFSSISTTWLTHAERYVAQMVNRLELSSRSHVVEIAANDGYLLQYVQQHGIPCMGVEPTACTAAAARAKGIPIVEDFFGVRLARSLVDQGKQADLIVANNVIAHVPDINDFVAGFTVLLKPQGTATFEFPHLLNLVEQNQFDTIYHEHYSYLSLTAVNTVLAANGLRVYDVEKLPTHGGSLRVFAQRSESGMQPVTPHVMALLDEERAAGITNPRFYAGFQEKAIRVKNDLLTFLIDSKKSGKKVGAYGAAAKGNTLLNYAGIRPDLLPWVVDRSPAKQGQYLPGSRIPIVPEERISEERPDYIVILPWNLREEITNQLAYVREWGGKFVVAVPALRVEI